MTFVTERSDQLDVFYEFIEELRDQCGGPRLLSECSGSTGWPRRGVYFFFEPGEVRADGRTPRVVRVGTHGLVPSKSTLWGRLSQHRGYVGGSRGGGGNHRGSIFRLHVGTALLNRDGWPDKIRRTWGKGSTADSNVREAEFELERAVTAYIGAMPFLWLEVDDDPSPASRRGTIERNAISILSNHERAELDPASPTWLGRWADRPLIAGSGLWNVNHVTDRPKADWLDNLRDH